MTAVRVPVSRILQHYLSLQQFRRYVNTEKRPAIQSPQYFYNAVLHDLSNRNTEAAIQSLIKILDLNPQHMPALHLARTMMVGLNKLFADSGGELYRAKYPNMAVWRSRTDQQIQAWEVEALRLRNEIAAIERKGFGFFGGQQRQQQVMMLKAELGKIPGYLDHLNREKQQAIKLGQIQDFSQVLSLMLEACLFPVRYSWLQDSTETSEAFQKSEWFG